MCWNLDKLIWLFATSFQLFCEIKCDIFEKKSINNHFKQPWLPLTSFDRVHSVHWKLMEWLSLETNQKILCFMSCDWQNQSGSVTNRIGSVTSNEHETFLMNEINNSVCREWIGWRVPVFQDGDYALTMDSASLSTTGGGGAIPFWRWRVCKAQKTPFFSIAVTHRPHIFYSCMSSHPKTHIFSFNLSLNAPWFEKLAFEKKILCISS